MVLHRKSRFFLKCNTRINKQNKFQYRLKQKLGKYKLQKFKNIIYELFNVTGSTNTLLPQ